MRRTLLRNLPIAAASLVFSTAAFGQSFGANGTTSLAVTVAAESAIEVTTASTALANTGTTFNPFTGTTNFTVKMRTIATGTVTLKVTTDFAGSGGPNVTTPPTAGDALTYTCAAIASGTPCTGTQTASTSAATPVATFGAAVHSTATGSTSSVSWSLTDDPVYATGNYTATVTFYVAQT